MLLVLCAGFFGASVCTFHPEHGLVALGATLELSGVPDWVQTIALLSQAPVALTDFDDGGAMARDGSRSEPMVFRWRGVAWILLVVACSGPARAPEPSGVEVTTSPIERASTQEPVLLAYELTRVESSSSIAHEVRRRGTWFSLTWESEGAMRSGDGSIAPRATDETPPLIVQTSDQLALVRFRLGEDLGYAIVRSGGGATQLETNFSPTTPVFAALDGSIVIAATTPLVIRPDASVEALHGPEAVALCSRTDGTVERVSYERIGRGAVRVVSERGDVRLLDLIGARPCETTRGTTARYWLAGEQPALTFELTNAESLDRERHVSDPVIDVDSAGRACVRSIAMALDHQRYEARPGGQLVRGRLAFVLRE